MGRIRLSTLWLLTALALMLVTLIALKDVLRQAHVDETILYVASDAASYLLLYEDFYENLDLAESAGLFLVGSPILFMKLAEGNLFLIQLVNLGVMGLSLWIARDCFATLRGRIAFMAGALVFPYFLFGFLSLNKEVYAMCSAIIYAGYMASGRRTHLWTALLLAACARYYMLVSLVTLLLLVPRGRPPRYRLTFALLIAISLSAPLVKSLVPGYSGEDLLEDSGAAGVFFSNLIDSFGYVIAYPIKYLALIPMRAYGLLIGSDRATDLIESVVSIETLAVLLPALGILFRQKPCSALSHRLVVAGLVAPIPIMWSEIMHWRYYAFVYFFFLYAIVLDREEQRSFGARRAVVQHA